MSAGVFREGLAGGDTFNQIALVTPYPALLKHPRMIFITQTNLDSSA